ncbi:thiamine pyrophosphate-binding protein [Actinomadura spongiicola]|uniref:Thiamine pyrophosphate-binding protein n=1 Tax=Actinomadura spongiicola TaxID=2303421 RepID=A0A372GB91_9ACTN|nr:thiamine pyrophosphate-binding protein [Actinomadura spongiicola]RFS82412.1 thiamine pyrophosphate-binding protein [Actinomadura spongiicola]
MKVAEAVGRHLARLGADTVFGVVGSGNFHVTNALIANGARFVAARHEGGAATMADAYARVSGGLGVVSVHQGPGLTNAVTGIAEAAKSRTPLLVVAGEVAASAVRSNFRVDQAALAAAVGAVPERVHSPGTALADVARACRTAVAERRTVLLGLPLDIQDAEYPDPAGPRPAPRSERRQDPSPVPPLPVPPRTAIVRLADVLEDARRPVFIAGRGARLSGAGEPLADLARRCGALNATSAVARGLFVGDPFGLDVSGGFATPAAADLIRGADLIVGWGCSLNMWTTRHGALVGADTTVVQVDVDARALGAHRPVDLGLIGDAAETARAVDAELDRRGHSASGYRTPEVAERLAREGRWQDVPYVEDSQHGGEDGGGDGPRIDPRTLSIALDRMLPRDRTVAVDSGNFMGYPAMFLDVPDADGLVFTQAFQAVGLGLATAIGAAVARPDRLTVAALGDGGALMAAVELETAVRQRLDLLVVVYDDEAYGAEVHHFGPGGHPLRTVTFPPTDLAAIGRGYGCDAVTVRRPEDLDAVAAWLAGPRDRPMVVDAKVTRGRPAWWLEEAFRGH